MKLPEVEPQVSPHSEAMDMLLASLPPGPELDRWARTTGALCRKRGVSGARELLRVALGYAFCGLSLEVAALWARHNGAARVCKTALLRRLRKCGDWFEQLIAEKLAKRLPPVAVAGGLRVRLVDATRVSCPGSKGQTWRVHASYDPWERRLLEVAITDNQGGEKLSRFQVRRGDLLVADRGYAHRRGLAHVKAGGGHFLVRTGWKTPLERPDGSSFDALACVRTLKEHEHADFDVVVAADERHGLPALPCRLVVLKKAAGDAKAARKKIVAEARKKKTKLAPQSLEAAGYIFLLTTVPHRTFPPERVLETYRLRWQIELAFKRLKSLMHLDEIRAKEPRLVRATLAAKLLGALLVEDLIARRTNGEYLQHAYWSLTSVFSDVVRLSVLGPEALARWLFGPQPPLQSPPDLKRRRQPQCLGTAALFA